jgi:hypothetical protein
MVVGILLAGSIISNAQAAKALVSDPYPQTVMENGVEKKVLVIGFLIACNGEPVSHVRSAVNNGLYYVLPSTMKPGAHYCKIQTIYNVPQQYTPTYTVGFNL